MSGLTFDYVRISVKVRETLQKAFGSNAAIRTDEGNAGDVYVRIVSDQFDSQSERAKQEMVWDALRQNLAAESTG